MTGVRIDRIVLVMETPRDGLAALAADARVTVRRAGPPDPDGRAVVYCMQRAQRGVDNPALDVAVDAANALGLPAVVFFGLMPYPTGNLRHYRFLVDGIADLAAALERRKVGFVLRCFPEHRLGRFLAEVRPALVVGDENPLRVPESWRCKLAEELRVPFWTVDADVIVPTRLLGKEQYAARTMRPRLNALVERFLVPPRDPQAHHAWRAPASLSPGPPLDRLLEALPIDRAVSPVSGICGGTRAAQARLAGFVHCSSGTLSGYRTARNRPRLDATSRLSPYLHFGQLGPRALALAIRAADAPALDKAAFLDELIVRRELAVNFVRYNRAYDRLDGCEPWARQTLDRHRRDRRFVVSPERLERAESPDPLWNAAQRQMLVEGWMHGYLRMYWAKKILEWSRTPEDAFVTAITLNDRYELDGRDPNGYAGIAWAIGGKHDRAWGPERPIFGTVRYMSLASTSRKLGARVRAGSAASEESHG